MSIGKYQKNMDLKPVKEQKEHSLLVELVIRLFKEKPLGAFGAVILLLLILTAIFAEFLAPYGMNELDLSARLSPPSPEHILGTDSLGRDLFSRIIIGSRVSVIVGLVVSFLSALVASIIGIISGYIGGKFDTVLQRIVDTWMCFPLLFILLTVMAVFGAGLVQLVVILGITMGITRSRVIRSAVIGIRENMYVEAAVAMGCSTSKILIRHILRNVMAPIIIIFSVEMASAILMEATMSFLGFGIPPPTPSWGSMLSGAGRSYMYEAPWLAIWPGLALGIAVFGVSMFGDAVRDILDPKLRGGLGRYGKDSQKILKKLTKNKA